MANKLFFQIEFQGGADVIKELAQVELELNNVKNQINQIITILHKKL